MTRKSVSFSACAVVLMVSLVALAAPAQDRPARVEVPEHAHVDMLSENEALRVVIGFMAVGFLTVCSAVATLVGTRYQLRTMATTLAVVVKQAGELLVSNDRHSTEIKRFEVEIVRMSKDVADVLVEIRELKRGLKAIEEEDEQADREEKSRSFKNEIVAELRRELRSGTAA